MDKGIDNTEQEIKENEERFIRDLSQSIDPVFQNDVTPQRSPNISLGLSPPWDYSESLCLSLNSWDLSLSVEKPFHSEIHLPRRRKFASLPMSLPVLFGTKLADPYSISTELSMGVLLGNRREASTTSNDSITPAGTPEYCTGSSRLGHPTMHEILCTLQLSVSFPGMVWASRINELPRWL